MIKPSIMMKKPFIRVSMIVALSLFSGASANTLATVTKNSSTIGSAGIGDSIFPMEGNGGIDVQHYDLNIQWDDKTGKLDANARLKIKSTQVLSKFNLDFHGLKISSIRVNNQKSTFAREKDELTITLPTLVKKGDIFNVSIAYAGKPSDVNDSVTVGWETLKEGVAALSEPISAKNWFPNNNHPKDKATYAFTITVPKTYDVVANGIPSKTIEKESTKTFHFETREPLASYLTMISIGHYDLEKLEAKDGTPIYNYYYKGMSEELKKPFENQTKILAFFSEIFGTYPFASAGVIVNSGESILAYETQTRPLFGTPTNERMVAHEIAHQWFGNVVSLSDWKETWLKEGFATYASALWFEHLHGKKTMDTWVKGSFESLMGIQYFPRIGLGKVFKIFEVKDKNLTAKQVETLINFGTKGKTDTKELKTALALVPTTGISIFKLDPIFTEISFKNFKLRFAEYINFMAIVDDRSNNDSRPFDEVIALIASAPENVNTLDQIYSSGVYTRGALAIHALRIKVGDEKFFSILKAYFKRFKNSDAGSKEFTTLANEVSGENLDTFFKQWLEDKMLPDIPEYGLYKETYAK